MSVTDSFTSRSDSGAGVDVTLNCAVSPSVIVPPIALIVTNGRGSGSSGCTGGVVGDVGGAVGTVGSPGSSGSIGSSGSSGVPGSSGSFGSSGVSGCPGVSGDFGSSGVSGVSGICCSGSGFETLPRQPATTEIAMRAASNEMVTGFMGPTSPPCERAQQMCNGGKRLFPVWDGSTPDYRSGRWRTVIGRQSGHQVGTWCGDDSASAASSAGGRMPRARARCTASSRPRAPSLAKMLRTRKRTPS